MEVLKLVQDVVPEAGLDPARMPTDVVAFLTRNSCNSEAMQETR